MTRKGNTDKIRGYCSQCSCWCPTISHVKDGLFVGVKPDEKHPLACGLCPKALAGPELVYSNQRLKYPMRRTRPKGDPDPGWERITWDEALEIVANKLNEDEVGNFLGFPTPSRRVEIYSLIFKEHGYDPILSSSCFFRKLKDSIFGPKAFNC